MNISLTRYRKQIIEIMKISACPLSMEDIHSRLEDPPNISTVYRALEYLEKHEIIKGFYYDDKTRYYIYKDRHGHFLFCKNCRKMELFDICIAKEVEKILRLKYNYKIIDHNFYFLGICPQCQKNADDEAVNV